jgi:hypothetical protein
VNKENVVYIHAMNYDLDIKKEILSWSTTWMNPEDSIRSEKSWLQKDKRCMIPY